MDVQSIDWQSLTFTGERHHMILRITGDAPTLALSRMCTGLEDAEFSLPGIIVADIAVVGAPERAADGSMIVTVEALTVSED